MGATVLGPATVVLAIATAFETVFGILKYEGYLMALMPVVFQMIISFTTKKNTQLIVCALLSTFYSCVMTVVAVGIIKGLVKSKDVDPSFLFLALMASSFIIAGIMHPYEFTCLLYGPIYFLCIPSGYLVLIVFALSNMQDISWGTRDLPKKKTKAELEEEKKREEKKQERKKRGWFSFLNFDSLLKELRDTSKSFFAEKKDDSTQTQMLKTLRGIQKDMKRINQRLAGGVMTTDSDSDDERKPDGKDEQQPEQPQEPALPEPEVEAQSTELAPFDDDDPDYPAWIRQWDGGFEVEGLEAGETLFWHQLIKKYLIPVSKDPFMNDPKYKKKMENELIELRNNVSFAFWLINGLWILFNYMIQTTDELSKTKIMSFEVQPLGFIFMILFVIALLLQFVGMLMHRWGTFLQLVAITELTSPFQRKQAAQQGDGPAIRKDMTVQDAVQVVKDMQKEHCKYDAPEDPAIDYSDEEDEEMLSPTQMTSDGATGGDRRQNGDVRHRHPRRIESLVTRDLVGTIRQRVVYRQRVDQDLQVNYTRSHLPSR